jgi:hypothetical protein
VGRAAATDDHARPTRANRFRSQVLASDASGAGRRARRSVGSGRRSITLAATNQIVEEVGHDRSIDSEVLGQGELAAYGALSRGGKDPLRS